MNHIEFWYAACSPFEQDSTWFGHCEIQSRGVQRKFNVELTYFNIVCVTSKYARLPKMPPRTFSWWAADVRPFFTVRTFLLGLGLLFHLSVCLSVNKFCCNNVVTQQVLMAVECHYNICINSFFLCVIVISRCSSVIAYAHRLTYGICGIHSAWTIWRTTKQESKAEYRKKEKKKTNGSQQHPRRS